MAESIIVRMQAMLGRSSPNPATAEMRMKYWLTHFMQKNYSTQPIDESKYEFGEWEDATECLYLGPQTSIIVNDYPTQLRRGAVISHPDVVAMIHRTGLNAKPLKNPNAPVRALPESDRFYRDIDENMSDPEFKAGYEEAGKEVAAVKPRKRGRPKKAGHISV